jgi:hypothetical protein
MDQTLSEQEVAQAFVHHLAAEAQRVWPRTYADLREIEPNLQVSREDVAAFELALAAIALGLQAVKNLFPAEQAERIRQRIFEAVDIDDWAAYATNALNEYVWVFDNGLATADSGGDPLSATSSRLLDRWIGEDIKRLTVKIEGVDTGAVSPLVIISLNVSLTEFATSWSWKTVREKFNIVSNNPSLSEGSKVESRLAQFLEGAANKLYRELIEHHIKRQAAAELGKALLGERAMLPSHLQPRAEYWLGYSCGTLAIDKGFWESASCRQAFERILNLAIETLPLQGKIDRVEDALKQENHGVAFQLFQIVTLNLAYLASTERPLRAVMGIRKGLFG